MSLVDLFKIWTGSLADYVEIAAAVIIGLAAAESTLRALWLFLQRQMPPEAKEDLRLRLARWLAVALELELAADILRTAIEPTWNGLGLLAAIAAIRTALNYFLEKEIARAAAKTVGAPASGNFTEEMQRNREVARQTGAIEPGTQATPTVDHPKTGPGGVGGGTSATSQTGRTNITRDGRENGHASPRQPATP